MLEIPISVIRDHLRLAPDDTSQDAEIERLYYVALAHAQDILSRPIPWSEIVTTETGTTTEMRFPDPVKHALLILIADFYENRESHVIGASVAKLDTVKNLLGPYRLLGA